MSRGVRWTEEELAAHQGGAPAGALDAKRPHKFHAVPTEVDGYLFPSAHEAERYVALRTLEQAGAIRGLRVQFPFPLRVGDQTIGEYRADFTYRDADGRTVVEDAKGVRTPLFRWKKLHFEAQYQLRVQEV